MAFTSSDLGDELGHGGTPPKRKRKPSMKKKGGDEMDAPSLMKELSKMKKGKSKAKAKGKKKAKKHHKKKAD